MGEYKHHNEKWGGEDVGSGKGEVAVSPRQLEMRKSNGKGIQNQRQRKQRWKVSIHKPEEKACCYRKFYKLYQWNKEFTFTEKVIQIIQGLI